jgi:protein arginine kinase
MLRDLPRGIQDRVGRALGIARGARLLDFGEALTLLSSIRLGIATGNAEGCSIQGINELLLASQNGHLEMKAGHTCDDLTLSMERADLFRARFA